MDRRPSPHAFSALAYGDYRLLWLGYLISNTGTWMQTFALGWYVVQLAQQEGAPERGPLYLGLVGASRAIPSLIAGLFAGAVSDRMDRRKLMMAVQIWSGAIAAILAVLALVGDLPLAPILIATALTGMLGPFDTAARQGMLPSLIPPSVLSSGVGLLIGTQNFATLLGPLIGGVSMNWIGVGGVLMCNAVSYVAIIAAVLLMSPVKAPARRPRANVFRTMQEGFAYVWREPVIRPLFLLLVLASVTGRPLTQMLPAVAADTLQVGALELSWLLAAAGIGALVGSIVSASLGNFHRHGFLVLVAAAISGVLLVGLGV